MAYIGRNPAIGTQKVLDSLESQFNGSLTTFDLRYKTNTIYPPIASALIVSLGGVLQEPGVAYTVASDTITFASAPPTGSDCWILLYTEFGGIAGATANLTVSNNLTIGNELHGPANFIIDPATIGDNTGTVEIKGNLTVQGTQTTVNSTTVDLDHLSLGDDEIANFGTDNDIQIVHESTGDKSVIKRTTTGDLYIQGASGSWIHIEALPGESSIKAAANGTVQLFYDNYKRLETTNAGITLTSDSDLSSAGPEFKLYRDSASPADADYLGQIKFAGESDTGVERNYAKITGKILDASNGTEDGIIEFAHIKAGSQTITGRWRSDSLQLLNSTQLTVNGSVTFDSTLTVGGEFTSNNGTIKRNVNDSSFAFSGGTASNVGANIVVYGGSHSSLANVIRFRTGGTENARITSAGALNIGRGDESSNAANLVEMYVGATNESYATIRGKYNRSNEYNRSEVRFGVEDNVNGRGFLAFATGNNSTTEAVRITYNQNVGINRTDPDQRLCVNGNIEVNAYDSANGANGYYTAKGLIIGNAYDAGKTTTDDRNAIIWQERGLDLDIATNDALRIKITYDGKVSISNDGTADGLLTIKGNSDATTTPSIRLLDGTDTREVSISNTAGDFVATTHGTDNNPHGQIKIFESGIISMSNGGASATFTERLRIDTDGAITVSSDGSDNDGANITLKHSNNNTTDTVSALIFSNNAGDVARIVGRTDGANNNGGITFHTDNTGSTGERLRIAGNGNVGIGTNNPGAMLEVWNGNVRVRNANDTESGGDYNTPALTIINTTVNKLAGIDFRPSTSTVSGAVVARIGAYNTLTGGTGYDGALTFSTRRNSGNVMAEKMRIDKDGNVGIGTNNAAVRLDVDGTLQLRAAGNYTTYATRIYSRLDSTHCSVIESYLNNNTAFEMIGTYADSGGANPRIVLGAGGQNVGINTTDPGYNLEVNGSFAATTKSFIIDHPTKPGMKLRHGSLEGPENGVYVRGRSHLEVINLPDYWSGLVDPDSITVTLTPIGPSGAPRVERIENNKVYVFSEDSRPLDYFYMINAERADVDPLEVEIPE